MKIVVMAPFAAGIGQRTARIVPITDDLQSAAKKLGENCVLEMPQALIADGRISIPLLPPDGLNPAAWRHREPQLAALEAAYIFLLNTEDGQPLAPIASQLCQRWPEISGSWTELKNQGPAADLTPLDGILNLVDLPASIHHSVQRDELSLWRKEIKEQQQQIITQVVQQPMFKMRVSAWQGLDWLFCSAAQQHEIFLIDADMESASEQLTNLTAELELLSPDLLLIDLEFSRTAHNLELLSKLTMLADRLLAPVLVWLGVEFFGISSWGELSKLSFLQNHISQPVYAKWRAICAKPEARWLNVSLGRFAVMQQQNREENGNSTARTTNWISPIWVVAAMALQQHNETGFPCPLSGQKGSREHAALNLEIPFSDDRHYQLLRVGMSPLTKIVATHVGFTALPQAGGGTLEQQLFLRWVLSWLFMEQERSSQSTADQLLATYYGQLEKTAIVSRAKASFTMANGLLKVQILPPHELVPVAEPITLQLPWEGCC